ncbi:MAG: cupin domain-containing protein [Paracoccaceae bacterium]|nr:cupin domain-containing protein [Paracoccaceae bacterium]
MDIFCETDRPSRRAPEKWFTGEVWMDPVIEAPEPARVRSLRVSFAPGARTNWHTHPLGQTIHIVAGVGRVQAEGGPVREVRAGDTVWFAPGERHWHGAALDHGMVHIAFQEALDGVQADWMEPVAEADYQAVPGSG